MIWIATFGFVLALVAVACAALALTISSRLTREQTSWRAQTETRFAKALATLNERASAVTSKLQELERHSPSKLSAEVAELSDAVIRLSETQRRFAGRWHAKRQHEPAPNSLLDADDEELSAMLALQRGAATKPPPP